MNNEQMKFKVLSPSHSNNIQLKLFELGYTWNNSSKTVMHTTMPFLYANSDGTIGFGELEEYFNDYTPLHKEFTIETRYELVAVQKSIEGIKEEINKKLTNLSLPELIKILNSIVCL
jgi:hypothetical protein